jgi:hypothetical protein
MGSVGQAGNLLGMGMGGEQYTQQMNYQQTQANRQQKAALSNSLMSLLGGFGLGQLGEKWGAGRQKDLYKSYYEEKRKGEPNY